MNYKLTYTIITIIVIFIFPSTGRGEFNQDALSKLKITTASIPEGFTYGKVPSAYKNIFKDNPWQMDATTIQKLTKNIYPDGDAQAVASIHVSIIADKKTPYGDDIVCYIILFKNLKVAEREINKINDYVQFNSDRAIVLSRSNLAVFLHVDDIVNFHHIRKLADDMEEKMDSIESATQCAAVK